MHHWGISVRLSASYDGVQYSLRDLQESEAFMLNLGLPPLQEEDPIPLPATPKLPMAPGHIWTPVRHRHHKATFTPQRRPLSSFPTRGTPIHVLVMISDLSWPPDIFMWPVTPYQGSFTPCPWGAPFVATFAFWFKSLTIYMFYVLYPRLSHSGGWRGTLLPLFWRSPCPSSWPEALTLAP